ncbi:outer membrane protein [Fulvitalea axinellae]|uniref:Outer membrane protein n=2 Tax=Fulvitalea axinellae TaxID=1182444 RepID=A0AAU9CR65_9BACT|nr:outer membrane protein [Fulvitalea axinellae]
MLLSAELFAQGSISGSITDKESGEEIIGGTAYISSIQKGAASDIYGKYMIKGVPAGTYSLVVKYIGYREQKVEGVEVKDGQVTELNISLVTDVSELDVVVVQASQINNNQTALLSMQRKALAVQDGISVSEIKKMGVSNAAESMKYVTGAAVEDGKYMVLRGLGDRYSLTQMNGVTMPSTDPYRNSASLDLVPTDMIDNIVTVKTFTADQPGNFTGGKVDITTKSLPEDFYMNFGVSTSFNTNSNLKSDFITDGAEGKLDWLGYDDGTRAKSKYLDFYKSYISNASAVANAYIEAAKEDNGQVRSIMDITARSLDNPYAHRKISSPLNTGVNFSIGNRFDLFGKPLGVNFGFKFDRTYSLVEGGETGIYEGTGKQDNLQSQQELTMTRSSVSSNLGGLLSLAYQIAPNHEISLMNMYSHDGDIVATEESGFWLTSGRDLFGTQSSRMEMRTLNNTQLSGKHYFEVFDGIKFDWVGGYVYSSLEEPDGRYFAYAGTNQAGPNEPKRYTYSMPKSEIGSLPSNFFRDLTDTQMNFKADVTIDFKSDSWFKVSTKFGGAYSKKEREFTENLYSMVEVPPSIGGVANDSYLRFGDVGEDFGRFFSTNNSGLLGVSINGDGESVYLMGNIYSDLSSDQNTYTGEETIVAGYGMGVFEFGPKFKLIGGLRIESTEMGAKSKDTRLEESKIEEVDFLPSLNTIIKLNEKMNLRAAYGRTLARPNMREISPFTMLVGIGKAFEAGNPDLKRTLIDNYDLRYEFYPNPGELLAVSAYYKKFTDPIVRTLLTNTGTTEIKPINVDEATVYGLEAEMRKNFGFITPELEDLVFSTNISFIFSESDMAKEEVEAQENAGFTDVETTRPFQGQSPYIINAALSYNWRRLQWENSFAFNYFGERLAFVTGALTSDVYEQPRPSLNFVSSKGFGDHLKLSVKATNILNMVYSKSYKDHEEKYYSRFERGTTFSLGLSYSL